MNVSSSHADKNQEYIPNTSVVRHPNKSPLKGKEFTVNAHPDKLMS